MQEKLFLVYYLLLLVSVIAGFTRYKILDDAMRIFVILLGFTSVVELATYFLLVTEHNNGKALLYHMWSIIEITIITWYFLKLNKPYHHATLIKLAVIVYPTTGIMNILFFQPINTLNTNVLMLESFITISLSLYSILQLLKKHTSTNIFYSPHLWICILWLLSWSSTFFFWAFIKILYSMGWEYRNAALNIQGAINILVYAGIAAILLLYPKMKTIEHI